MAIASPNFNIVTIFRPQKVTDIMFELQSQVFEIGNFSSQEKQVMIQCCFIIPIDNGL
jgi:hypothetical protein